MSPLRYACPQAGLPQTAIASAFPNQRSEAVLQDYNLQVSLFPSAPCNLDPISQNSSIPEPAVAPDGGGEICACLRACVSLHEERGGRFVTEASMRVSRTKRLAGLETTMHACP